MVGYQLGKIGCLIYKARRISLAKLVLNSIPTYYMQVARETNIALLGKVVWNIEHKKDKIWVEVIREKYIKEQWILVNLALSFRMAMGLRLAMVAILFGMFHGLPVRT